MEKKLSKKTLTKSFHNWYYGNLTCFSQEHMQTFGYLCSMLPVVEELYDKKEDQARSMKTYTAFVTICFNKIAIPTHGNNDPTVNKVFIANPSIGNVVLISSIRRRSFSKKYSCFR